MRPRSLMIRPEQDGRNLRSLLSSEMEMSARQISRLKRRENGILLNGAPAYTTACAHAGDILTAEIGDPPCVPRPEPMAFPLSVVYEDEYLLVVNKPAGLSVHASTRCLGELTLENALAAYLPPDCGMHPVSRLDRGTTGLLTVARSGYIHELLRRRQHTAALSKTYLALCTRAPSPAQGRIDAPLGYAEGSRYKMAVNAGGAPSVTVYETVGGAGELTLVRLMPQSGRTHQIRVHMASIGCPLLGDWLYGEEDARIRRPALHAHTLLLQHPITGETLHLLAPLPEDMKALIGAELSDSLRLVFDGESR